MPFKKKKKRRQPQLTMLLNVLHNGSDQQWDFVAWLAALLHLLQRDTKHPGCAEGLAQVTREALPHRFHSRTASVALYGQQNPSNHGNVTNTTTKTKQLYAERGRSKPRSHSCFAQTLGWGAGWQNYVKRSNSLQTCYTAHTDGSRWLSCKVIHHIISLSINIIYKSHKIQRTHQNTSCVPFQCAFIYNNNNTNKNKYIQWIVKYKKNTVLLTVFLI